MSAQHAPAPWTVFVVPNESSGLFTIRDEGGTPIATVAAYHGTSRKGREATARLIAAAPELLGTLQLIARGYGVTFQDAALRNLVLDTIAKATGSPA